jgi:sortase A
MNEQEAERLSVDELQQLLYRKKRAERQSRLERLRGAGRVVDVAGLAPPQPPPLPQNRLQAKAVGAMRRYAAEEERPLSPTTADIPKQPAPLRRLLNTLLLLVEIGAVVGLLAILFGLWQTNQELNRELAAVQRVESQLVALPTPTATPVIGVVVLPSGHKPPVDGRSPEPGEAGDIPSHLLPAINAYQPPPFPTPGPEQARRIQIPAIDVDNVIVQGDDWEQLKKGVGHHIGSAQPGQTGNVVLSAHNDIFGEIFRHLDKLSPGDEITISTEVRSYTYLVRKIEVVEPTDVWVMAPTEHASTTLISCYPYRVNTQRIIVFADLVTDRLGAVEPYSVSSMSVVSSQYVDENSPFGFHPSSF